MDIPYIPLMSIAGEEGGGIIGGDEGISKSP